MPGPTLQFPAILQVWDLAGRFGVEGIAFVIVLVGDEA
jgi:hypothetical protein